MPARSGEETYVFKLYDRNRAKAAPTGSLAQQSAAPAKPVAEEQLKSQLVNADQLTVADARSAPQSTAAPAAQQQQTFNLSAIQPAGALQSPGAVQPAAGLQIAPAAGQIASASVVAANAGISPRETQTAFGISPPGDPYAGILSEIRGGLLAHDVGLVSARTETGVDFNGELLFASPGFLKYVGSPRPHVGFALNSSGDTSQFYFGTTWSLDIWRGLFFDLSFGGSVHSGILTSSDSDDVLDDNEFGCRLLFRESLELGWRFNERHSISAMVDHISNAGICDANDGMDNAGIRYGYKF